MNEFTAWIQNNWYALGNLLSQIAFLGAGLWFARKILKTIRASQEQVGALLKLSVTGGLNERHSPASAATGSFANASPYWLTPSEVPPATSLTLPESRPGAWHSVIVWLKTPMTSGRAMRKAIRWLQSPART